MASKESANPDTVFTGGCRCGAIRYRATASPAGICVCHCRACQQLSGTFFLTFGDVPLGDFHFVPSSNDTTLRKLNLTDQAERAFCTACGTPIYMYYWNEPKVIGVAVGTVDPHTMRDWRGEDGQPWKVRKHIFLSEKAPWEILPDDGAPRFDTM